MLLEYIEKVVDEGRTKYRCTLCGTVNGQRAHSENHVENIHFPNQFLYECDVCGLKLKSKTARNNHKAKNHKY